MCLPPGVGFGRVVTASLVRGRPQARSGAPGDGVGGDDVEAEVTGGERGYRGGAERVLGGMTTLRQRS